MSVSPKSRAHRDNDWQAAPPPPTPLLAHLFRPLVWVARALAWLTEPEESRGHSRGKIAITGQVLLFSAGMIYSFGLTCESMLVLLNAGTREIYGTQQQAEAIRFMPKLGVEDGARLGRLLPSPLKLIRLTSNLAFGWLPGYQAFGNVAFDRYLVWADPNFYVALVLAAIVGLCQAKALRTVSIKVRKARLDQVRTYRVEDLSPKALTIAKIRNQEYRHAEVGNYLFHGAVIAGTYAFEIGTFLFSFAHAGSSLTFLVINGVIEVTGFEVCYKLTGLTDGDEEL
jgi:hypothetical protein